MKDNKKLLKGLAVGALVCAGLFTFTGCSISLSDSQVKKVEYAIENSEKFMDDALALMEKQYAELSKDEIWDMYNNAENKMIFNVDGVRNNLTIDYVQEGDHPQEFSIHLVKTADGKTIMLQSDKNGVYNGITYQDADGVYSYSKNGATTSKEKLTVSNVDSYVNWDSVSLARAYTSGEDDIVACEKLENGNYKISFVSEIYQQIEEGGKLVNGDLVTTYLNVEISEEGLIVSQQLWGGVLGKNVDSNPMTLSFIYDDVKMADVNTMLTEAKAASIS